MYPIFVRCAHPQYYNVSSTFALIFQWPKTKTQRIFKANFKYLLSIKDKGSIIKSENIKGIEWLVDWLMPIGNYIIVIYILMIQFTVIPTQAMKLCMGDSSIFGTLKKISHWFE